MKHLNTLYVYSEKSEVKTFELAPTITLSEKMKNIYVDVY